MDGFETRHYIALAGAVVIVILFIWGLSASNRAIATDADEHESHGSRFPVALFLVIAFALFAQWVATQSPYYTFTWTR